MKKIILTMGLAGGLGLVGNAQKSAESELPIRLFLQGEKMFHDRNWIGTQHRLTEFKKLSTDADLLAESDYMIVASIYHRGDTEAMEALQSYLESHNSTIHRPELTFFIGSLYFEAENWQNAVRWLQESDLDYLTDSQQEDCTFRLAYSEMRTGNKNEAYRLFALLAQHSKKYADDAGYYKAFIDFEEKRYEASTPVFQRLASGRSKYRQNASFHLVQTAFAKKQTAEVQEQGENFLREYPDSEHRAEVSRMLGNTYFRQGKLSQSVAHYEVYETSTDRPLAEDMLLMGSAYNSLGNYQKASNVLKKAVPSDNICGQEAYFQLGTAEERLGNTSSALLAFEAASKSSHNPAISEAALFNYIMLVHRSSASPMSKTTMFRRFLEAYPRSKYTTQVNSVLAEVLLSSQNYAESLAIIASLKNPDSQILSAKQQLLTGWGIQAYIDGNYPLAISRLTEVEGMGKYNNEARTQALFWRGEAHYKQQQFALASNDYKAFLGQASAKTENVQTAHYNLGYAYFKLKRYADAGSEFQKYISRETNTKSPAYADALNRLGDTYLFARNYSQAEVSYSCSASLTPTRADYAEFQKAFVLGLKHNYSQKVLALDELMKRYSDSPYFNHALYEKSRSLAMLGKEREAIPVLEKLLNNRPDADLLAQAGVLLGQMYDNTNQPDKALTAYKNVVSQTPESDEAHIAVQGIEGIYKEQNNISAYASYVNSLGNSGFSLSASRQDSLTFLSAENAYMKARNKQTARTNFTNYLKSYPSGAYAGDAHYYLASIATDEDEANSQWRNAIRLNSRFKKEALQELADAEFERNNYNEAYDYYQRLNGLSSDASVKQTAQVGMLKSASKSGKDAEVIAVSTTLIDNPKTSPENLAEALLLRGKAYLALKKGDLAAADLRQCAGDTRYVQGAESQYLLTDLFYRWKSYDKAIAQAGDFMEKGTTHQYWLARTVIVLADAYLAKGDTFSAKQYLESLRDSYQGTEADIAKMISTRLAKMNH